MSKIRLISFIFCIFIFCLVLEASIFDNDLQERLSLENSYAKNSVDKNEKVLDFIKGGNLTLNMTEDEQSHLKDVRDLHNSFLWFVIFLGLLCLILVFLYFSDISKILFYLWIPFGLYLIFLMFAILFPDVLFMLFHEIFFPQGNFIFSSDSFLITLYPSNFFYNFFYVVSARFIVLTSILILMGFVFKHYKKNIKG